MERGAGGRGAGTERAELVNHSPLQSVLRVRLRVTIFCILSLPRVTLGVTAKEVKYLNWQMLLEKLYFTISY